MSSQAVVPANDALGASLTRSGVVLGTFAYMSLEQLSGKPADELSDQFSFCVSLYEAVYGERPFLGFSAGEMAAALMDGRVSPPTTGRRGPARLRRVLLRGLAKDPARRWPSMDALLVELRAVSRSRRGGLVAIAVVLVATLAVVRWSTGLPWADDTGASAASESTIAAHVQAARSAAARAAYVHTRPDEPLARTAYLEVIALEGLGDELGEGAIEAASQLRTEFANTLLQLGDRYWDSPGGRRFAEEHYIEALVFDPRLERAQARAPITHHALSELQRRAATPGFVRAEP